MVDFVEDRPFGNTERRSWPRVVRRHLGVALQRTLLQCAIFVLAAAVLGSFLVVLAATQPHANSPVAQSTNCP